MDSPAEQQTVKPPDMVARRDQLIAQYNDHGTLAVELRQRLAQVEAQRLKLEGAIALIGELLGEQTEGDGGG